MKPFGPDRIFSPNTQAKRPRASESRSASPQAGAISQPQTMWREERDERGIPTRMLCPISQQIMLDPVVLSDGNSYDRPFIAPILRAPAPKSPLTREKVSRRVFPNELLRREVYDFLENTPALRPALTARQSDIVAQAQALGIAKHQAYASLVASYLNKDASIEQFLQQMPQPRLRPNANGSPTEARPQRYSLEEAPPASPPAALLAQGLPPLPGVAARRQLEQVWHDAVGSSALNFASQAVYEMTTSLQQSLGTARLPSVNPSGMSEHSAAQQASLLGAYVGFNANSDDAESPRNSALSSLGSNMSFDMDAFLNDEE